MRRPVALYLLLLFCVAVLAPLAIAARGCEEVVQADRDLIDSIHQHETGLSSIVAAMRKGGDAKVEIELLVKAWSEVDAVRMDANGNVYFILDWNTFANFGVVNRNGDAALLGDSVEPVVRDSVHLVGSWWRYRAS